SAWSRGRGDLTRLAREGKKALGSKVPMSGTAERQAWQRALGGGTALGGFLGYQMGEPLAGAVLGTIGEPMLTGAARGALFSSPVQSYLREGAPGLNQLPQGLFDVGRGAAVHGPRSIFDSLEERR
ncbi:unnamed protein product, partial [marine sediment metagenome]